MKTIRLTMAQALVRFLVNQRTLIDGKEEALFPGVFAIFGHGNVTCLGEALETVREEMPTWRGQNEQSMALAGVAYAKAKRRRQIMVATSSIGPGCTNLLTAAATAHANRLPILLLSGDTFANRLPDPVLQQVENFQNPTMTVTDAFQAFTRYWDRINRPEQLISSLPQMVATLLDPADCGPVFLALPQDIQAEAFDYPEVFFEKTVHQIPRPRPDRNSIAEAATILRNAEKPLIISGGGVFYSGAVSELVSFAETFNIPVVETIAGRSAMLHDHPHNAGPLGVIGSSSANMLAEEADVVVAVGTRLQFFTTGSWSVFGNEQMRLIAINAARYDAHKHRALSVVGDALAGIEELGQALEGWKAPDTWISQSRSLYAEWNTTVEQHSGPTTDVPPSYAHVIGAVNRVCDETDLALTAAGGFPGELCKNWKTKSSGTFDCEFGFSCMGYEVAAGIGVDMAAPDRPNVVFAGDGSYLMLNAELATAVMMGTRMTLIITDNRGFGCINRLQAGTGGAAFNNLFVDSHHEVLPEIDFVAHAASMGARAQKAGSIAELESMAAEAIGRDGVDVIVIDTDPGPSTAAGGTWWEVGVPEVSDRAEVASAYEGWLDGKKRQLMRGE